jgi:hypothetical protein
LNFVDDFIYRDFGDKDVTKEGLLLDGNIAVGFGSAA